MGVTKTTVSLIPKAVKYANTKLYAKFPELNGRKITNNISDKKYKEEWNKFYKEGKTQNALMASNASSSIKNPAVLPCALKSVKNPGSSPSVDKTSKDQKNKCKFSSVDIVKKDRKFTLILTPNKIESAPKQLEVVGGENNLPSEITSKINGLVHSGASCSHLQSTFNIFFSNSLLLSPLSLTELKFKAFAPYHDSFDIWNVNPVQYSFNVTTCGTQAGTTIAVYPDTEYDVAIEFPKPQYKNENKLTPKDNNKYVEIENTKSTEWGLAISGSIKKDGIPLKVEYEFSNEISKIEKISKISRGLQEHLSILQNAGKVEPISFTIKFPNFKFTYNGHWAELEGSPLCDFENELSFRFDPLIGVEVNVDLIATAAIAFGGPLAIILNKVRGLAKKNIDIKFNLVLTGEAGGGWTGKYLKNAKKWQSSDKDITVPVTAKIEAGVEGKLDLYIIFFGAGAEGSAEGGIEFKGIVDADAKLMVTAQHNGLKFTGVVYILGGVRKFWADDEESESRDNFEMEVEIIPPQEDPLILYPF